MPVLSTDSRSVTEAVKVLRSGNPVVVPMPSPLGYVVAGTDAASVNAAKMRPVDQPVGVSVADIDVLAAHLDVSVGVVPLARWLCESELVSLLVPVRPGAPAWLAPAISDGMVFFTAAPWLPELDRIINTFGCLYMTSANITGRSTAVTATQAREAFGDDVVVLDGDALRDSSSPHGSTTMVRVDATGELTIARSGINNQRFGGDLAGYVADLRRRWHAARPR